jgi:hypothetical protein
MAFVAGYVLMPAVQRECSPHVVKQPCLPVEIVMAFQARSTLGSELSVVNLPVAVQAVGRELGELLHHRSLAPGPEMAGPAGLLSMGAFQQVVCKGMVEGDVAPSGIFVAGGALLVRVILLIQDRRMDVFVTVLTQGADPPEFPAISFPVAVKAWDGQVRPTESKWRLLMLFYGEKGRGEPVLAMALRAIGHRDSGGELFPVVVRMAVGAARVFQRHRVAFLVAGGT